MPEISDIAKHYISMLQLSAVAATLQENAYVSDATFFLQLVYIILTQNAPAEFHRDIESLPFARVGDAQGIANAMGAQHGDRSFEKREQSKAV